MVYDRRMTTNETTKTSKYAELCERVRDQIVTALRTADANGWEQPWTFGNMGHGVPRNAKTGNRYKGMNAWWFMGQGFESPWFATFKQWLDLGYVVASGVGSGIAGIKWIEKKPTKKQKAEGVKVERGLIPCGFTVFNFEQVKPLEEFEGVRWMPPVIEVTPIEREAQADEFFERVGAKVHYGGSRAYYSPMADLIQMPHAEDFLSVDGFYSTLAHEHGHWTGHADRLGRDLSVRFGSESYAMEELVAEMTAAFTMAHLGLSAMPRKDHADYLANWLQVLEGDARVVYAAAKAAGDAFEVLAGFSDTAAVEVADDEDEAAAMVAAA